MTTTAPTLRAIADSHDREAWLAARRNGVTATDVAKVGRGGAATMRAILADKRGELRDFRNSAMSYGTRREDFIATWVEHASAAGRFGSARFKATHALYANQDNDRHLATPDMVSSDFEFFRECVEIKTTNKPWSSIPASYLRQAQWQMHVLGADRCLFVWEVHENYVPVDLEPQTQWVLRDQTEIDQLVVKADQVLAYMDRVAPTPAPAVDARITRYLVLQEKLAPITAEMAEIEQWCRERYGEDGAVELGTIGDLSIGRPSESMRFDSTRFKAEHPDEYEQYQKPVKAKGRFSITPIQVPSAEEESAA